MSKIVKTEESKNPIIPILRREFLRRARAHKAAGLEVRLGAVTQILDETRESVGLARYKGGAASDFIQKVTEGYKLAPENSDRILFRRDESKQLVPLVDKWNSDWRAIFAPSHQFVRWIERTGCLRYDPQSQLGTFVPVDPVFPQVEFFLAGVGDTKVAKNFERLLASGAEFVHGVPGIYFMHDAGGQVYIGKSDEPSTRLGSHKTAQKFEIERMIFITRSLKEGLVSHDVMDASESLAITFWGEIAEVANRTSGSDKAPSELFRLREASAFVTVASALVLRLAKLHSTNAASEGAQFKADFKAGIEEHYFKSGD